MVGGWTFYARTAFLSTAAVKVIVAFTGSSGDITGKGVKWYFKVLSGGPETEQP